MASSASPCRELDRIVFAATAQMAVTGQSHCKNTLAAAPPARATKAEWSAEGNAGSPGDVRHAGSTRRRRSAVAAAAAPEFAELPPRVQAEMQLLGLGGMSSTAALEQLHRVLRKSEAEEATARHKFQAARLRFVRPLIDIPTDPPRSTASHRIRSARN